MSYVLLGILVVLGSLLGRIAGKAILVLFSRYADRYREQRLLRLVRAELPEAEVITIITVGPSSKATINDAERKLRDAARTHQ